MVDGGGEPLLPLFSLHPPLPQVCLLQCARRVRAVTFVPADTTGNKSFYLESAGLLGAEGKASCCNLKPFFCLLAGAKGQKMKKVIFTD